jgi:organic hydroperoxide reductase OsmC/OhrA
MTHTHTYRSQLTWKGSTAAGYDAYDRTHRIVVPGADSELVLSSDPAFRGRADLPNPEQLLVASASSCQLLSFLAFAARSRIEVLAYDDEAEAVMPEDEQPMRITRISLAPRIVVGEGTDLKRVQKLVERAHEHCFIANTLNAEIVVDPVLEVSQMASGSSESHSSRS